jgi:hypothetical protein
MILGRASRRARVSYTSWRRPRREIPRRRKYTVHASSSSFTNVESSFKPRAYLRKSRPSTANMLAGTDEQDHAPTTPSRPATSHLLSSPRASTLSPDTARSPTPFASARSRHTIHFSPDTVPEEYPDRPKTGTPRPQAPARWSTLTRPKSRQRPSSSGGLLNVGSGDGAERPMTSASGYHGKEKRKWSESLKKIFK